MKDKIEKAAEYYAHNNFNMHETNSYKELKKGFKAGVDWETIKNWAKSPVQTKDKIVEDLKREFDIRSCVGIDKYKTTLQDNNKDDFLQHLKEELMDAALYIQKLQSNESKR